MRSSSQDPPLSSNVFEPDDEESEEEEECSCLSPKGLRQKQPQGDNAFLLFLRDNTVHGFKYIGQLDQPILFRLFWTLAVLAAFGVSFYLIELGVVLPMQANPVIISFQKAEVTIDRIPFPAFTVCAASKMKTEVFSEMKDKVNKDLVMYQAFLRDSTNLTAKDYLGTNNVTKEDLSGRYGAVLYLINLCLDTESFMEHFYRENANFTNPLNFTEDQVDLVMPYARPALHTCEDTILLCLWAGEAVNCSDLFYPRLTEFGHCCTFNAMPEFLLRRIDFNQSTKLREYLKLNNTNNSGLFARKDYRKMFEKWKLWNDTLLTDLDQENYFTKVKIDPDIPRRQRRAGLSSGLSILLNPTIRAKDSQCRSMEGAGFRVQVHSATDRPHIASFGKAIQPNSETFMAVDATVTVAEANIVEVHEDKRKCYFENEHRLMAFNLYSRKNCLDECMMNITLKQCDCVRHFMPRQGSQRYCVTEKDIVCSRNVTRKIRKDGIQCKDCRPSCRHIEYSAETSELPLRDDISLWNNALNSSGRWAKEDLSIVHVYFSKNTVSSKVRKILYGFSDIIATAGGLLGLTLGFSMISVVELGYFGLKQFWRLLTRRRRHTIGVSNDVVSSSIHVKRIEVRKIAVRQAGSESAVVPWTTNPYWAKFYSAYPQKERGNNEQNIIPKEWFGP